MTYGHIIALPKAGNTLLKDWWVDQPPNMDSWDEEAFKKPWMELCLDFVTFSKEKNVTAMEVFVCVMDHVLIYPDCYFIDRLLTVAQEHVWGADIFIVCSIDLKVDDLGENASYIDDWLKAIRSKKIRDICQVDYGRHTNNPAQDYSKENFPKIGDLRKAANRVRLRREAMVTMGSSGPWRCPRDSKRVKRLKAFLHPYHFDPSHDQDDNLVILIDDIEPIEQVRKIKQILDIDGKKSRRYQVVTDHHPFQDQRYQLLEFCRRHRLNPPLTILGDFELWFFLYRINQNKAQTVSNANPHPNIKAVPLDPSPVFQKAKTLSVLFSSAFDLDEPKQCIEAARDIGRLLLESEDQFNYLVCPAATIERFKVYLGLMQEIHVWVHMGHGIDGEGFIEAETGYAIHPSKWLQCIQSLANPKLRLVLFLSCDSIEAAEDFARAGVGVAIGFEGMVESTKTRELAAAVFKVAVGGTLNQRDILRAFEKGCSGFKGVVQNSALPFAFYPD